MDGALLNFLAREREEKITLGGRDCALRLLSARETLALRGAIARGEFSDEDERALYANASLLATSLFCEGRRAFESAEEVLSALGIGELNALIERYAILDGCPSPEDGRETAESLKKAWSTRPTSG